MTEDPFDDAGESFRPQGPYGEILMAAALGVFRRASARPETPPAARRGTTAESEFRSPAE